MESDWRMNVAVQGYIGLGFNMCARLLHPFLYLEEWVANSFSPTAGIVFHPLIAADGEMTFELLSLPQGRFPYGIEVAPDHP